MKKLIIHADDYGMNQQVSDSILELYQKGYLTSASIMTNFEAFDYSVDLQRNSGLDLGLHLNLLDGNPVSSKTAKSGLVDKEGRFLRSPYRLYQIIKMGCVTEVQLEYEIRAQIEKALDSGIMLSHLDGHEHVHMFPVVNNLVIKLAKEYAIKAVRIPEDSFKIWEVPINRKFVISSLSYYARKMRKVLARENVLTTDCFTGVEYVGAINVPILVDVIQKIPEGTTELMCHPIRRPVYESYYRNGMQWVKNHCFEREYYTLCDKRVKKELEKNNVTLIHFGQIV